jgi:hypothetical protein
MGIPAFLFIGQEKIGNALMYIKDFWGRLEQL